MKHYYDTRLNKPLYKEEVEALGVPLDKLHTIGIYPVFNAVTEPSPYERTVGYEYGELRQDGKIAWYNVIEPLSEAQQLKVAKSLKMDELNKTASDKILAGFWYQDPSLMSQQLHFSFGVEDQSNFNSAMNGANLYLTSQVSGQTRSTPTTIMWNGYTDLTHQNLVRIEFDATTFIQFWGYAETVHKNGILSEVGVLKQQVTAATTREEVEAIVWEVEEDV